MIGPSLGVTVHSYIWFVEGINSNSDATPVSFSNDGDNNN